MTNQTVTHLVTLPLAEQVAAVIGGRDRDLARRIAVQGMKNARHYCIKNGFSYRDPYAAGEVAPVDCWPDMVLPWPSVPLLDDLAPLFGSGEAARKVAKSAVSKMRAYVRKNELNHFDDYVTTMQQRARELEAGALLDQFASTVEAAGMALYSATIGTGAGDTVTYLNHGHNADAPGVDDGEVAA